MYCGDCQAHHGPGGCDALEELREIARERRSCADDCPKCGEPLAECICLDMTAAELIAEHTGRES